MKSRKFVALGAALLAACAWSTASLAEQEPAN